ncbi:MAG: glycosyltransferase [Chlorobiota bacterium]|jgi:processive 1,2-diacylglycerol beta-glucosyltransferase|nr:glycosyltransferase [Chlorobiota bacterium]QQS66265.1 MAG: glycosyltransferase [Chlorobiota bacterium]
MFNKVLVISASSGGGHLRVAEALVTAFGNKNATRQIYHIDALQFMPKTFRKFYAETYFDLIRNVPDIVGWVYKNLDKPWKNNSSRSSIDKMNSRKLVKLLKILDPDYVVCTHFLPASVISDLIENEKISCKLSIVITDYHAHALWLCKNVDRYFVPTDEVKEHLISVGILDEKISTTGIPIDPAFMNKLDKSEARSILNLPLKDKIILISAGGFGHGLTADYLIESLMRMTKKAHIVVICGKNESIKLRLQELIDIAVENGKIDNLTFDIIGYTTKMVEYMSAADIVVGKPGGSTTAEAMAKGLAFVVVNPIPGQEVYNADFITEQGAAIKSNNLSTLAYKIDKIIEDEIQLNKMKENALRISSPDAAYKVVDILIDNQIIE